MRKQKEREFLRNGNIYACTRACIVKNAMVLGASEGGWECRMV